MGVGLILPLSIQASLSTVLFSLRLGFPWPRLLKLLAIYVRLPYPGLMCRTGYNLMCPSSGLLGVLSSYGCSVILRARSSGLPSLVMCLLLDLILTRSHLACFSLLLLFLDKGNGLCLALAIATVVLADVGWLRCR